MGHNLNSFSLSFRDYAVHFFPGSLLLAAFIYGFSSFDVLNQSSAPIILALFVIGGYIVGFVAEAAVTVFGLNPVLMRLGGKDPLSDFFENIEISETPKTPNDRVASILVRDYGEAFVKQNKFSVLMFLMMRDVEAANERSAVFISRISSLENMCKGLAVSFFFAGLFLIVREFRFAKFSTAETATFSSNLEVLYGLALGVVALILLRRRHKYRIWLAKTVVRVYIALDRQSGLSQDN